MGGGRCGVWRGGQASKRQQDGRGQQVASQLQSVQQDAQPDGPKQLPAQAADDKPGPGTTAKQEK